jgi:RNA polymerase sporulation-specific sigma factor
MKTMINSMEHIGLVKVITAKRYKQFKYRCEYEDLFQVGYMGLIKAAKKYDESKNVKFSTYASAWIDGYIRNFIRGDKWYFGKNENERIKANAPASLNNIVDNSNVSYLELIEDESNHYELSDLRMLVNRLPFNLKKVIVLRYFRGLTQSQTGKSLKMAQSAVSRYEKEALLILREELVG